MQEVRFHYPWVRVSAFRGAVYRQPLGWNGDFGSTLHVRWMTHTIYPILLHMTWVGPLALPTIVIMPSQWARLKCLFITLYLLHSCLQAHPPSANYLMRTMLNYSGWNVVIDGIPLGFFLKSSYPFIFLNISFPTSSMQDLRTHYPWLLPWV